LLTTCTRITTKLSKCKWCSDTSFNNSASVIVRNNEVLNQVSMKNWCNLIEILCIVHTSNSHSCGDQPLSYLPPVSRSLYQVFCALFCDETILHNENKAAIGVYAYFLCGWWKQKPQTAEDTWLHATSNWDKLYC